MNGSHYSGSSPNGRPYHSTDPSYFTSSYLQPLPQSAPFQQPQQPGSSNGFNQVGPTQSLQENITRIKLPNRLLTNDAEIEPHEFDYKSEWKSAALKPDLIKVLDRLELHQCRQEKAVDLLLEVQANGGSDPPGAMFHDMAFHIERNEYECSKKGCNYKGTAEHMRQHLHRKDHLGIPLFPCQFQNWYVISRKADPKGLLFDI
jgi:hypothetical protein